MAEPPDRVHCSELLSCLPSSSDEAFDHRRGDEGGRDRVHPNAAAGELERGGRGQSLEGVLACVVKAEIGDPDMARDAARVDDCAAAAAQHGTDLVFHRCRNAPHIDVEHATEIAVCDCLDRSAQFDPAIVEGAVESPMI
jgi:hypothetical protein